jgi:hypothetical protein
MIKGDHMKKREIIFIITGYDELIKESGTMINSVVYEVYANSIDEAIEKAKTLYPKSGYHVSRIIEK